jgi:hypothetical protein
MIEIGNSGWYFVSCSAWLIPMSSILKSEGYMTFANSDKYLVDLRLL